MKILYPQFRPRGEQLGFLYSRGKYSRDLNSCSRSHFFASSLSLESMPSTIIFEGRSPSVFAAIFTLAFVAAIVFPLRLYVRISRKSFGYDDWCMVAAMVSSSPD